MKQEFYLQDDKSNKFWTIEVIDSTVVTSNGRMGAKPHETKTEFASPELAKRAAEKEVHAKLKKGYTKGNLAEIPAHDKRLPPKLLRINHDDYHAKYVGKTKAGEQFFLTFPFAPTLNGQIGGNYIALYRFDEFGALTQSQIYYEHAEGLTTQTAVDKFVDRLLEGLGPHRFCNIRVSPFSLEKFGRTFGLVFDPGEESDNEDDDFDVCVTVEPGNYMAFNPPWDGEYDT